MASLGETLLKRNLINLIQLNLALDFKVFYGCRLGTNLLELGVLSEEQLAIGLSESLGIPAIFGEELENIPWEIIKKIPPEIAYRSQVVPFRLIDSHLYVAMLDPRNQKAHEELRQASPHPLLIHVVPELRIFMALERYYQIRMEPRMRNLATKIQLMDFGKKKESNRVIIQKSEEGQKVDTFGISPKDEGNASREQKTDEPLPVNESQQPGKVSLSVQKIAWMLDMAKTRDEIAELMLQFTQKYLERAALFVLRKDMGFGWDARGGKLDREKIRSVVIPLNEPSIFQTVVSSQGHFLGSIPPTRINQKFLELRDEEPPKNALLLPLTVGGITFGLIYGDNGKRGVNPDGINELQVMISRANIAFERLIISGREKALKQHARA